MKNQRAIHTSTVMYRIQFEGFDPQLRILMPFLKCHLKEACSNQHVLFNACSVRVAESHVVLSSRMILFSSSSTIPTSSFSFVLGNTISTRVARSQVVLSFFRVSASTSEQKRTSCVSALSACTKQFNSAVEILLSASSEAETSSKSDSVTKLRCFDD